MLLTDKGILPIESLSNKQEEKINIKVLSYDGKKNKASTFFNSGKHKIIKIMTKSGYELEGSYNHPILTWVMGLDFKPRLFWKTLGSLQEGEIAIINRDEGLFSQTSTNIKKYHPKTGFKNNISLPGKMNNDLAFLLGALVSEGSFHNNQILFCNQDEDFYNKVKSIIKSQFKGIQIYENKLKGNCSQLSIYEQKAVIFLKEIGLTNVKSDKKEIPFSVLMSSKENIKHFLTALFEGDGSVSFVSDKRHGGKCITLVYDSKSETLIRQLKTILLNFGIVSNYPQKDKRNGCLKLVISSFDNIYRFYDELGFFSTRKNNILSLIKSINPSRLSTSDFIPFLNDYLRIKYSDNVIKRYNFDRYPALIKNFSKISTILEKEDQNFISKLIKHRFYFDQLIKVEKIETNKSVFSVKVDSNCHSFVANGFINHNTEAKMNILAEEMLADLDKETVNMIPNFDGALKEPIVLPSRIPNLLINGSSGIAVGMATNMPPHNIVEVCDAGIALIDNPDLTQFDLIQYVKGPDFPTGGTIIGKSGIRDAYGTGRGSVVVRAKAEVEVHNGRQRIIITEIPYQVNKSTLIEHIADSVRNKIIIGISDLRDESDRDGMRIVIEIKKDANPEVVLNQLYKHSALESSFGIINLAIVNGEPKVLNLKEILVNYILHRKDVITRRTAFELKKTEDRLHILIGLIIALNNIDEVVQKIKKSQGTQEALAMLISDYTLSEIQSKEILDMKLQKLSSLEQEKIKDEERHLKNYAVELKSILESEPKVMQLIKKDLLEVKEKYGDKRRTQIVEGNVDDAVEEDLIEKQDVVVTMSHAGYVKRIPVDTYRAQKRGGKGIIAAETREEDYIENLFTANTHSQILFFTNLGNVHWLKVYEIPEGSRQAKGKAIVNLLNLKENEHVSAFIPVDKFDEQHYLVLATKQGTVKKTNLMEYSRPRQGGIKGILLEDNDELIGAKLTDGNKELMLVTKNGNAARFHEEDARSIGRTSKGVRGISLKDNDEVVSLLICEAGKTVFTITKNGFGKRSEVEEYRLIGRGGVGVINIQCSDRNGHVVTSLCVDNNDELMIISKNGITIRTPVQGINVIGRNTQGVRMMKLDDNDEVVSATKIAQE
ncbi:MAG: DNA gyrase subunit A [Nanoarchaeota archaeon]